MRVLLHSEQMITPQVINILSKAKEVSGVQETFDFAPLEDGYIPPSGAVVLSLGSYKRRGGERVVQTYSVAQVLSKGDSITRLAGAFRQLVSVPELPPFTYKVLKDLDDLQLFSHLSPVVVDIETKGIVDKQVPSWNEIIAISLYNGLGDVRVIPEELVQSYQDEIHSFLESHDLIGHNLKFDGKYLNVKPADDTMLMHYSIQPAASDHGLKALAKEYFGADDWDAGNKKYLGKKTYKEFTELGDGAYAQALEYPSGSGFERIPRTELYEYAGKDVYWTYYLFRALRAQLGEFAEHPYDHLMELSHIYQDIEFGGVRFDRKYMEEFKEQLQREGQALEQEFNEFFGRTVNPRSPKQVKEAFAELGYDLASTDTATMEGLAPTCEPAELLLKLRKNNKILGTYIGGYLDKLIGDTGYQTFKLHASITGRIGGGGASMLTIPRDKKVKRMVLPDPGHVLVSSDLSQAELRCMAVESDDPWLISAFQPGAGDFFDLLMHNTYPDIDPKELKASDPQKYTDTRAKFKGVVYGVSFGRGVKAIAQALNIDVTESQKLVDGFVRPGSPFAEWRAEIERKALSGEPIVNPLGRRFQQELVTHKNRQNVINSALSFTSQSTANDICLLGLKGVVEKLKAYPDARVLGTVHDCIYVSCPPEIAPEMEVLLSSELENAGKLLYGDVVAFKSDPQTGNNMAEV